MPNEKNLKPFTSDQSREEAVTNGRKGGVKSGETKRRKKAVGQLLKMAMEDAAPEALRKAYEKAGMEIESNRDMLVAAILLGVGKQNPKSIEQALELMGEDPKTKLRKQEAKLARERFELEKQKAALEIERQRFILDRVKGVADDEMPDDGFLAALTGYAADDWEKGDD